MSIPLLSRNLHSKSTNIEIFSEPLAYFLKFSMRFLSNDKYVSKNLAE